MKKLCASLTLCLFFLSASFFAYDWSATVRRVDASVVRLEHPVTMTNIFTGETLEMKSACTGFVINQREGYVMTAYHCLNDGTTVNLSVDKKIGQANWLVFADEKLDIAVVSAPVTTRPALKPSRVGLQKGQEIGALGFGYGLQRSLFRAGYVSNIAVDVDPEIPGPWFLFDGPFIGGMSGGPVFNTRGEVVSVVQMSNELMGLGRPFSRIYSATRAFWG
jgi:S1-C subfamily serine protease